jgi:DNA-binding transcriptional LysR family regulator
MRFQRLDLNLLVALDALLTERSVSLAADRICLSQSATSGALSRLREYFGDELLVMKGRQMVLTGRGESLLEPVRAVLRQIHSTIAVPPPFDPATSDRTMTIMTSDYLTEVLLSTAIDDILRDAPGMRFEILSMNDHIIETLERGEMDLLITIDYAISPDHPSRALFEDDYVVVGWEGNPAMHGTMTRELYFELGHVTTRFGRARLPAFEDWFIREQDQQRRVEIVASNFLTVPGLVVGTNRIATMHRRLAQRSAASLPLVIKPVPMTIPGIRSAAQWHLLNNNDPAIGWVVDRIAAHAAHVPEAMDHGQAAGENNVVEMDPARLKAMPHSELTRQYQHGTVRRLADSLR